VCYIKFKSNNCVVFSEREWLSQPWKRLTVEFRKETDTRTKSFSMNGNILSELQYTFKTEMKYVESTLHNMFVEIMNNTDDFKIQLTSKEEYTEDQIKAILKAIALKPKSFAFRLQSNDKLRHAIPTQIAEKKAIAINDHGTFVCIARDDDVLDRLLFEMGYSEIEKIDLNKRELDLHSLGLVPANIHSNLAKVDINQADTPNRCVFRWQGRKKAKAVDLVEAFKNKCNKVQIVFESSNENGEPSTNWTNLAIELMFESKRKLKEGYLQQFNNLRYDKRLKRKRFCALEHSDKRIWLYSPEDLECVTKLKSDIEASVTRHQVRKGLLGLPAMRNLLQKHHLKCCTMKDTIICTQDINLEIITIISKPEGDDIPDSELKGGNKPNGKSRFSILPTPSIITLIRTPAVSH